MERTWCLLLSDKLYSFAAQTLLGPEYWTPAMALCLLLYLVGVETEDLVGNSVAVARKNFPRGLFLCLTY